MMNVSDSYVSARKNSFDFEECGAIDADSWNGTGTIAGSASSTIDVVVSRTNDESVISIFARSIEIFGNTMAPWPSTKSLPEQVSGIFIKSETESINRSVDQHGTTLEANKPRIQSKLRRSTSKTRQLSLSRVNEEHFVDSLQVYRNLVPIPIVSCDRKLLHPQSSTKDDPVPEDGFHKDQQQRGKYSRLQTWLTSLYSRANSIGPLKIRDEEFSNHEQKPLKSILKKKTNSDSLEESVQKSAIINETEAIGIIYKSTPMNVVMCNSQKPQKSNKLRFDGEVAVCETFHREDYCRQSLDYVARQLTPTLALAIKKELNSVKQEMEVHDDSRHLTQFYFIK
jgi:hypothetical protein